MGDKLKKTNMFINKQILIITISRKKIGVYLVDTGNNKIIEKTEKDWNPENIKDAKDTVDSLLQTLGENKIRILLKEDVYYLVELPYFEYTTRKKILTKVSEKIPENLDEYSWDYKKDEEKEKIIAFAPVKHIYENVVKPLKDAEMEIEAVEPESISKERNENPIIGLALKRDIKGKDEKVLNLKTPETKKKDKPTKNEKEIGKEKKDKSNSLKSKKNILMIILSLVLFIGAGGIMANYLISNKKTEETENQPQQIEKQKPNEEEVEEEKEEISLQEKIEQVNLLVLNGSGTAGAAGNVEAILEAEGFQSIELGEADNYDYQKTQISTKEEVDTRVLDTIDRALNSEYDLEFTEDYLSEENENSIILIVGQRIN